MKRNYIFQESYIIFFQKASVMKEFHENFISKPKSEEQKGVSTLRCLK